MSRAPSQAEAVHVLLIDPSARGGIASYTHALATALETAGARPELLASRELAAARRTYRIRRWLPSLRWDRPSNAGATFFAGRLAGWLASSIAAGIAATLARPDVIHFQAPFNRRFDAFLVRLLRTLAPVIWTAHDVLPHEHAEADAGRFASIYRAVDAVIVHVEPAAAALRELSGVEPTVIEHPVPEAGFVGTREEARELLGLPREGRLLAALGFIRPYKGYELLADVWDRLGASAPLLLVMGEVLGEVGATLERLRRSSEVVLRTGYASDTELHAAVRAADALLLPYRSAADSGLIHLARSLGVPVIASDAPQLAASVRGTRAGRVVRREVGAWCDAVTEALPAAPPPPTPLADIGRAHLELYREACAARARR